MMFFATFVALIFGIVGREGGLGRVFYGLKIFAAFVGVGLGLAWLLYWIP